MRTAAATEELDDTAGERNSAPIFPSQDTTQPLRFPPFRRTWSTRPAGTRYARSGLSRMALPAWPSPRVPGVPENKRSRSRPLEPCQPRGQHACAATGGSSPPGDGAMGAPDLLLACVKPQPLHGDRPGRSLTVASRERWPSCGEASAPAPAAFLGTVPGTEGERGGAGGRRGYSCPGTGWCRARWGC